MPRATQEGLRPGLPLLTHAELIDLPRMLNGNSPLLGPTEIPIHPAAYKSPLVFTPDFGAQVADSLPEFIAEDLKAIEAIDERKLTGIRVQDRVLKFRGVELPLSFFHFDVEPELFWVELSHQANGANIRIDKRNDYRGDLFQPAASMPSDPRFRYPMDMEKQKKYWIDKDDPEMITWLRNNIATRGILVNLVFRNAAIAFNNLGLQKVGAV